MEQLTLTTFKEKIFLLETEEWNYQGKKPALIYFYAEWCGPCKTMTPILEELTTEHPEVEFYKVNVDEEAALAKIFNIQSIPTLMFIPLEGHPVSSSDTIKWALEKALQEVFEI